MLTSRDGSVTAELFKSFSSFLLTTDPYVTATGAGESLRWSNMFNAIATTDPKAIAFTASQSLTTVTATTNVFSSSDVGRLIVFDSGAVAFITVYLTAATVTVGTSQTVASGTARMMTVLGRTDGATNKYTLVTVSRPLYITNTDSKVPTLAGVRSVRSSGVAYVGNYQIVPREATNVNGWNDYRGFRITGSTDSGLNAAPFDVLGNLDAESWNVVAMVQNGTTQGLFVNGAYNSATVSNCGDLGLNMIGFPSHLYGASTLNVDLDGMTNGIGWPMARLATMMLFDRVLTQQELLDLYGMIKFGQGYCISRDGLAVWWVCRRDAVTAAHVTTLPAAGGVFDTPRASYALPDLSGHARHARLYSQKAAWSNLLGGTDSNPGIYLPRTWFDSNIIYDGTNDYTKQILKVPSYGVPLFE